MDPATLREGLTLALCALPVAAFTAWFFRPRRHRQYDQIAREAVNRGMIARGRDEMDYLEMIDQHRCPGC
jgi:hypothetical protein